MGDFEGRTLKVRPSVFAGVRIDAPMPEMRPAEHDEIQLLRNLPDRVSIGDVGPRLVAEASLPGVPRRESQDE